jgi:hypothetical protein
MVAPAPVLPEADRREAVDPFAEIRHEVGNFLHKLYYLAESIGERGAADGSMARSAQELGDTLRGLDSFLALAVQLCQPVTLERMTLPAAALVAGLVARAHGRLGERLDVRATSETWGDAVVSIDPVRLPTAFEAAVEIAAGDGSLSIDATPTAAGVQIRLLGATPPTQDAPADAILRWSIAERVVALHGAAFLVDTDARTVTLFVPYHF